MIYVSQLNLSPCQTLDKSNEKYMCHFNLFHYKRVDKSDEQCKTGRIKDSLSKLILYHAFRISPIKERITSKRKNIAKKKSFMFSYSLYDLSQRRRGC